MSNTAKLFGKITDFSKVPLNDAEIQLMDKDWNIPFNARTSYIDDVESVNVILNEN